MAGLAEEALGNRELALQVAGHKTWFFRERSAEGRVISYPEAVERYRRG